MKTYITVKELKAFLVPVCASLIECTDELNTVDGKLGDGDIGITMSRASHQIQSVMDDLPEDMGKALLLIAQSITKSRASSYGTLLATGVMAMAKEAKGSVQIETEQLPEMLEAAVDKMAARGKSALGEKTVLDVIDAIRAALEKRQNNECALVVSRKAAIDCLEAYRNKPCKQGRARIFSDKSVGLDDPGMVVIKKMLEAAPQTIN